MNVSLLLTFAFFSVLAAADNKGSHCHGTQKFFKRFGVESALEGHVIEKYSVTSLAECVLKCSSSLPDCKSLNYFTRDDSQSAAVCEINNSTKSQANRDDFFYRENSEYYEPVTDESEGQPECSKCYVDGEWTLAARFSNKDAKNWMEDRGTWWYDRVEPYGDTLDPSHNTDMISEAFWSQQGSELKITKSDDPKHTALLTTTGNCLNGMTFRDKLKSYGMFRGSDVWAERECQGSCSVVYDFENTDVTKVSGFSQVKCDGSVQTRNNTGFWCGYHVSGAVVMIGGGGYRCRPGEHGIGITRGGKKFQSSAKECDYGDDGDAGKNCPATSYSLNLWVRRISVDTPSLP